MTPTKRQIAKVIRTAAKQLPKFPRATAALQAVCRTKGGRDWVYYDRAVETLKAYTGTSFTSLLNEDTAEIQTAMRRAARALEHGLSI